MVGSNPHTKKPPPAGTKEGNKETFWLSRI